MEKLFISAESLLRDSLTLGRQVVDSGFAPTVLAAIWRGGAPIGISVQEVLYYHGISSDHIAIRTSSYTGIDQQAPIVRVHAIDYLVSRLTCDDRLLLVDDVFDSGRSIDAVITTLQQRCKRNYPAQVKVATAYYKPSRNRTQRVPDFYVQSTEQWLVFPHELLGLTREEILAHKPVAASFLEPVRRHTDG